MTQNCDEKTQLNSADSLIREVQDLKTTIDTLNQEELKYMATRVLTQVQLAMSQRLAEKYWFSREDATNEELIDVVKSTKEFLQKEISDDEYAAKAKAIYSDNTPGRKALGVAMCALGVISLALGIATFLAFNAALFIGIVSIPLLVSAITLAVSTIYQAVILGLLLCATALTAAVFQAFPKLAVLPVAFLYIAEFLACAPAIGGYHVISEGIGFFSDRKPTSNIAKSMDALRAEKNEPPKTEGSDNKFDLRSQEVEPIYPAISASTF